MISGDIANPKLPEEYEHAKTLLGPAGEQAVSLEFEPRWPEVFKIEPQGSTCTRGSPARDSEAWSPMVCQPANFLVLILMAMPIRRPTHLITACFNYQPTHSFFGNLQRLYSFCRGNPAMAINGRRNKPFGPGGSTRRLHQSPASTGLRRGRNRIDEGVKGVLLLGMVPPLSGHFIVANDNYAPVAQAA